MNTAQDTNAISYSRIYYNREIRNVAFGNLSIVSLSMIMERGHLTITL